MPDCIHKLGISLKKQQQLYHPDPIETQIEIGTRIKPLELYQWTAGHVETLGRISEETLVFFVQQARLKSEASDVSDDVALILDDRLRHGIANRFRRLVPREQLEDFSERVSECFWIRVLDPADTTASWAQVSFWPFVCGLARDLLKKERFEDQLFLPLGFENTSNHSHDAGISDPLSLDNGLLIRELWHFLTPAQKHVFVQRYYYGLSTAEIAVESDRSERAVQLLLKAARIRLRQVIQ